MKLHSPAFEKVLRCEVKRAARSSPALQQEYRRANKGIRKRRKVNGIIWLILSVVVGFVIWVLVKITGHPVTGLAAINLMTLFLAASYVRNLPGAIFRATDLPALTLLPLSESEVFHWELQKFVRRIAVFPLIAMFSGYGALGIYLHLSFVQWIGAAILAILSWATLLALAALCAARFPKLPYPIFTASVYLFGFGLLMSWKAFGAATLHFIDGIAPVLNLLLPTGWCPSLFQLLREEGEWWPALLIVPIALIVWSLKSSFELLRSRLRYKEHVIPESPDMIPGTNPNASGTKNGAAQPSPVHVGTIVIEEIIHTRQFLVRESWDKRGWFEKLLWRWLDPREKTLAEFAFPRGFSITRPWKTLLRNFSVTVLAGFVAGMVNLTIEFWVFGIGLAITFLHALALIWGNGSAFRALFSSGVRMHTYAVYPITYRELSHMLFKASVIQLPMFIAYTAACAVLISHLAGTPIVWGIVIGFKAGLLIFAARLITTTLAFSASTNDTSQFRLRTFALVFVFIGMACAFVALGGASIFAHNPFVAWLLFFEAVFDAYALFRIYGWFHSMNKFDLMNFAQR